MIFNKFIRHNYATLGNEKISLDPSTITLYPVSEYNLEGVKLLIETCKRMGGQNNNVQIATVDPYLWIGDFLDKYWKNISFVSSKSEFEILKIEEGKIVNKNYRVESIELQNDEELDNFFVKNKYKNLVLFSVVKNVNLENLRTYYRLRFSDITEKYEERDNKIKEILK